MENGCKLLNDHEKKLLIAGCHWVQAVQEPGKECLY
jgi:hypothetical protein